MFIINTCSVLLVHTLIGPLKPQRFRPCSWNRCRRCKLFLSTSLFFPFTTDCFPPTACQLAHTVGWCHLACHVTFWRRQRFWGLVYPVCVWACWSLLVSVGTHGNFRGNSGDRCSSTSFITTEIIQIVTRTRRTSYQVLEGK